MRGRISFQVDWDKIVTVPWLDPRGRMGWNGVELQGGAGGSVTDRPTDRLVPRLEKEQGEKGGGTNERQNRRVPRILCFRSGTRLATCGLVTRFLSGYRLHPGGRVDDKEEGRRYYR